MSEQGSSGTVAAPTHDELAWRYHKDPIFHAVVHLLGAGGWVDDKGVRCSGPSIADGEKAWRFMASLEAVGLRITAASAADRRTR